MRITRFKMINKEPIMKLETAKRENKQWHKAGIVPKKTEKECKAKWDCTRSRQRNWRMLDQRLCFLFFQRAQYTDASFQYSEIMTQSANCRPRTRDTTARLWKLLISMPLPRLPLSLPTLLLFSLPLHSSHTCSYPTHQIAGGQPVNCFHIPTLQLPLPPPDNPFHS